MTIFQNLSYWERTTYLQGIDLAIIGSGIVGLNAAIAFQQKHPKAKVVVLERGIFPSGASTKNAGFACFGSVSELLDDLEQMGEKAVLDLVAKRWRGLQKLRELCGDDHLEYQPWGGYELFIKEEAFKKCEAYIPYFNEKLAPIVGQKTIFAKIRTPQQFGFGKVKNLIFNQAEGQINPAKMMQRLRFLAQQLGIEILTGITVTDFSENSQGVELHLEERNTIQTAKLLLATNGFTKKLLPTIDLSPARNQVLITEPIPNLTLKGTFHFDQGYYYFRNVGNRILLGGARNQAKTEETTDEFGLTSLIQNTLEDFLRTVILPNQSVKIAHRWSGILGVGAQKMPKFVGRMRGYDHPGYHRDIGTHESLAQA
ncbi:MAG: FAD-dependent oxidoreductase, partial [Bacteroidota bacterium]